MDGDSIYWSKQTMKIEASRILFHFSFLILFLCLRPSLLSAKPLEDLFSLSLKALSELKITTATLTSSTLSTNPSSITIITQNQILRPPR